MERRRFTKLNIFVADTVQDVVAETEEGHEGQQMTTHNKSRSEHSDVNKNTSHDSPLSRRSNLSDKDIKLGRETDSR